MFKKLTKMAYLTCFLGGALSLGAAESYNNSYNNNNPDNNSPSGFEKNKDYNESNNNSNNYQNNDDSDNEKNISYRDGRYGRNGYYYRNDNRYYRGNNGYYNNGNLYYNNDSYYRNGNGYYDSGSGYYNSGNGYYNNGNGYNDGGSGSGYYNSGSGYYNNDGSNDPRSIRKNNDKNSNDQSKYRYNKQTSDNGDYSNNGQRVPDQELSNEINKKLSPGWFSNDYSQVNAQVSDGVVTLTGSVKTWSDKEKIEKEIRNTNGVVGLNSQLNVQEPDSKNPGREFPQDTASSAIDKQLNKKIRDAVSLGWFWNSYKTVTLNTTNGVVTLEGTLDKQEDEQKLMRDIQKIDGVKQVNSNIKIKNAH